LRAYLRPRATWLDSRAAPLQPRQKALQQMNVQRPQGLTDLTGTTALAISRAIVAGERDPVPLARFRDRRGARRTEERAQALPGP
jgi:transposase